MLQAQKHWESDKTLPARLPVGSIEGEQGNAVTSGIQEIRLDDLMDSSSREL